MRTIELSNHVSDMQKQAERKRRAQYDAAQADYRAALDARRQRALALHRQARQAWRTGRYRDWGRAVVKRATHGMARAPKKPKMQAAGEREQIWAVGNQGEARVRALLDDIFNDDCTLLSGYKNRSGEIDQIVVGPAGVVAIEVKNISGTIHCNGNQWWRDKYDGRSNCVAAGVPIQDKGGRGPSAQLNHSANRLEAFLNGKLDATVQVTRWVVLAHPRANLGHIQSPTVDLVITLHALNRDAADRIDEFIKPCAANTDAMVQLIRQDHAAHTKRGHHRRQQRKRKNTEQIRPKRQ